MPAQPGYPQRAMEIITAPHRPAVQRALRNAFGAAAPDAIAPISGGMSGAQVFRIEVAGRAFVLRIDGGRDALRDPHRWHACMRIAAEARVAPPVLWADADDGVAITALIEARPLAPDGDREAMVDRIARTVRTLHAAPPFPPLVDYLDGLDSMIAQFHAHGGPLADAAQGALARHAANAAAYRRLPPEPVSSHNDITPRNLLHDGARMWLIDWEASFLADRYVDLSSVANFFGLHGALLDRFLTAYFGAAPTTEQRDRLTLARSINQLFYAMVFLNGAAAERPDAWALERDLAAPTLAEIGQGLASGTFAIDNWEGRVTYGKARLNAVV